MEQINYKLEKFEGPLDVLLALIEKNKIDIYDIPIVEITEQYLDYVSHMETENLDVVSDFLVMAATLLEIKSKMLLPKEKTEDGETIDPRSELVERLLEYKKYKDLGKTLHEYEDTAAQHMYKSPTIPKNVASYIPDLDYDELLKGIDLNLLASICKDVLIRMDNRVDKMRAGFGAVKKEKIPLETKIIDVLDYAREKRNFSFQSMLETAESKTEVVVTFLAILELIKMGKLTAYQKENLGEIDIELVDSSDSTLDFSNLEDD